MDAAEKFWTLPELGETLVSLLDPRSVLHLAQSAVMKTKQHREVVPNFRLQGLDPIPKSFYELSPFTIFLLYF